jgi:hypothetical protein
MDSNGDDKERGILLRSAPIPDARSSSRIGTTIMPPAPQRSKTRAARVYYHRGENRS